MAYYDQIKTLKDSLNGYSEEEEKISLLYKTAKENAEKEAEESKKQLEQQFYRDKNQVYADNARDERNFNNLLAERGLGFSGEAAQAKLNSNITLNNRLGELVREKNKAAAQYDIELSKTVSNLSMEEAEKLNDMLKDKNGLNVQIAEMELKKETDDANRAAEKEMLADKLASEKELQDEKLKAEKENTAAKIQAEIDLQNAKIQAEKDMQEKELAAKYYNAISGNSGGSSDSSSGSSSGSSYNSEKDKTAQEDNIEGYIPDISAKELAGKLITATGHQNIQSEWDNYTLNKYLLELLNNYNMNDDYYKELLFVLKAYGYEEISEPEMRVQVIAFEMKDYYDANYESLFDKYVVLGHSEEKASEKAKEDILNHQLDTIYKRTENLTEFRMCCIKMGFSTTQTQEYINRKISQANKTSGGTGSGTPSFPNRVAK